MSRLSYMLKRIGDILPRCKTYGQLFSTHQPLQNAITQLYKEVISFVDRAKEVFASSSTVISKAVWKKFDDEFETSLESIRRWSEMVDTEADVAHKVEADAARRKNADELAYLKAQLGHLQTTVESQSGIQGKRHLRTRCQSQQVLTCQCSTITSQYCLLAELQAMPGRTECHGKCSRRFMLRLDSPATRAP